MFVPQVHIWFCGVILKEAMIRRRIPFMQIAFVTLIGVGGGVYIYRPYFVNNMKTPVEQNQNVPKKQSET